MMSKKMTSKTVNPNLSSRSSYANACKGKQDATSAPISNNYKEDYKNSFKKSNK